ncbi:MAG: hypothetical protein ACD_21C00310G0003 [uncultured bacterium]|nr:MAG: hypothetical protein ACD_21C00310G0003 [uncultured bacterium]
MRKLIIALLLAITIPAHATSGKIAEYSLPNGLKLFVKEDHRAPIVVAQIWYKIGSSYEPTGLTGISHALEHMMFRGTAKYGPGVLNKIIVDNGGVHNAGTDYDATVYYETLPSDKLAIAFDLEANRMQGLLISKESFAKEIQAVIEERKMRTEDNPDDLTFERFSAAAYASNPYHNPVIGWMHDIKNLTNRDLRAWYRQWYAPNNAFIVVVGDVQPEAVFKLAQEYFGPIPSAKKPVLKPQQEIPSLGERNVIVKAPAKNPLLIMGYNAPTLKTADQKWKAYALEVASNILSGGWGARLSKDLVRKQQVAVNASASYNLYSRLDNLFILSGTPAPKHTVEELKTAFLQQIERLQTTLVTQEELDRVKAQAISNKVYAKDVRTFQAFEIGGLEAVGLSWKEADQYVPNIKAVTPEQIQEVAKEYLIPDRLTVAELQPISTTSSTGVK